MALNQLETRQARQSECGAGGRFAFPWQFEHRQALWIRRLRPACGAEWEYSSWILFLDRPSEERQGEETGRGTYTQGNLGATHSSLSQRCSQLSLSLSHTHIQSECIRPDRWQIGNQFTWIPSRSLLMHQKLSASMFRNTSSCKLETLKFSTSSSAKSQKTKENKKQTEKKNNSERQRERKMERETRV